MNGLVNRLRQILNSQFYVMNNSWLRECIEYYVTNHDKPNDKEIIEFVKAQWQLSDLRDINNETGCLPKNLVQQKLTVLYGTYILQMDKMIDIATSKYKQLEQIRNISNANIEATEDNIPQSWEPRKKRMIQLYLTDGIQSVTAIEYSPISKLNDMLLPGYKIMIIGPVKCRRGIILLEEINFKEVGGELESLLIPNAIENVLARALQLEENPNPYNDSEQVSDNNQTNQNNRPNDETNFFEQDFEIDLEEVAQLEQQSCEVDEIHKNNNSNATDSNQCENVIAEPLRPNDPSIVKTEVKGDLNEILDLDDDILEMIDENQLNDINIRSDIGNTTKNNCNANLVTPLRTIPRDHSNSMDSDIVVIENTDEKNEPKSYKPATFHINRTMEKRNAEFHKIDYKSKIVDSPSHSKKTESLQNYFDNITERRTTKNLPNAYVASSLEISKVDADKTKMPRESGKDLTASKAISPSLISGKRSASMVSPLLPGTSKVRCLQETPKKNIILDYIQKGNPNASPPKICDFICDIITETFTEITFKTVRGRVTTIGKLSKKDLFWLLEGTITDGTASLDVSFASELLESLLGFSVQEFSQKKKMKKTNPEVEQELRMALRNAELKLKDLDALLELEMTQSNKPKVVSITNLTPEQKNIIEKRMKMLMI